MRESSSRRNRGGKYLTRRRRPGKYLAPRGSRRPAARSTPRAAAPRTENRKRLHTFSSAAALILTAACVVPYVYIIGRSFLGTEGLTLEYYYVVFLSQSQYLVRFWRSLALSLVIAAAQVLISTLAGYSFAKYDFPGKNGIFFAMMVLMIMPLQVTLVPNYLVLDDLGLLNTVYSLALPAFFIPLGTFIMTQSFQSVPNEIIEAARLDGCGTLGIIRRIAAPMNKSGLVCTMLLSFLDSWNMVEQPMVYLDSFDQYPISVGLASVPSEDPTIQLVACVLVALPPLFLFSYYNRELVEGIALGGEK